MMRPTLAQRRLAALPFALAAIGLAAGCERQPEQNGVGARAGAQGQRTALASPCTGIGVPAISQQPVLTGDFATAGDQIGADCMAWQSFIALNWAADPANPGQPSPTATWADFGSPTATGQTVWESYQNSTAVFNPPARSRLLWSAPRPARMQLFRTSKLHNTEINLQGIVQAAGNWLTAQGGNLTFYQVNLNQDEFEFITGNVFNGNDLTTFAGQQACASQAGQAGNGGFNLPVGGGGNAAAINDYTCTGTARKYGQNVGAIEVKSAWVALPADGSLNYRYLTSPATIVDPFGNQTNVTVGLVGLHIIRRVPGAPQFVWSTFEQIDNSPDENASNPQGWSDPVLPANPNQQPRPGYTYFNPSCVAATDAYHCQHNPSAVACNPAGQPAGCVTPCNLQGQPTGCIPYSAPMQITRMTPVDSIANSVTGYVWSMLPTNSVFNYYRLVNVQWPANPTPISPGARVNLTTGDITPSTRVANTTLETTVQTSTGCMTCHQGAQIAVPPPPGRALAAGHPRRRVLFVAQTGQPAPTPQYASSYSFLFFTETVR